MPFTRPLVELCSGIGFQLELLFGTLARLHDLPRRMRTVAEILYQGAVQGLHVVLLVGLFIGMIVALQTGIELQRIGQQDQIGTIVAISMAREMGPFITCTILAATMGSSMAAEIGTMAVSDELAALEVLSIDRIKLLVLPRLVAVVLAAPLLTILCDSIGIFGGGFVAQYQLHVSSQLYFDSAIEALRDPARIFPLPKDLYAGLFKSGIFGGGFVAQSQLHVSSQLYYDSAVEALRDPAHLFPLPKDLYAGLFKSGIFGILIAIIGCSSGLRAGGGALGVGKATRAAVRDSIIAIIIANYFITWMLY